MRFTIYCILLWVTAAHSQTTEKSAAAEIIFNPKFKHSAARPSASLSLSSKIPEGSGLAAWNGLLWTLNDSDDSRLYALDTINGSIVSEYPLPIKNHDWEDLSQDDKYFYIGGFGNNIGARDTLKIYKVSKQSLLAQRPVIDSIAFEWPETITDGRHESNNPDCEAMAVIGDSIYLFTKEWKKCRRTRVFSLPAAPGNYTAKYRSTLKTRLLVTGACYNASQHSLVLCGYNLLARPFVLHFSAYNGVAFFSGKARKVKIRKRFRQTEGIATFDGKTYFIVNEDLHFLFLHTAAAIQRIAIRQ